MKQPIKAFPSLEEAREASFEWNPLNKTDRDVLVGIGKAITGLGEQAWDGFSFIMEQPRHLFMQEVVGSGVKAGEWADLWRAQWDDPDHKQFRYHNAQVFREQAGMLWAIWESLEWQPGKTFAYGVNWEKASQLVSSGEADRWAEANPEAVDQIFKIPLDPWFLAGAGVRLAQGTMKPLHIKYLLPIAQRMRQAAKNGTSAMRVAYELHGPDLGLSFMKGVLTAPSDLKAAEFMYTEGARSAPWTMGLAEVLPIPKYFKRAGEAYSPQLREKAEQMVEHRTAVKEAYHAALQKIQELLPWLDEQGLKNAQRLLEIIPRESSAPGLSFRRNYWQALNHPGAGATAKQVGQWKFVQSTTPEEFKAAEIMAETIGAAWRPGTPWRANYSPGWVAVMRKEGSAAAQAFIAKMGKAGQGIGQVAAPWRKKRLLSPKQFKLRENLEKWISHVATREFRKGELDPFLRELENHRAMLKHGMKNTADKAIKAALERDISHLEEMAKELKGFRESGIIDEMDKLSPGSKGTVNAFLRGWARVIGWERKLQIGATPAFHVRNFVDSHLIRNALKMGEVELPAGKEIWDGAIPLRTPSGKALSFGRGQTAAIFGDDPKGIAAIGKNIEDTARNILGQRVFAEKMGEFINQGIPLQVAEEKAITLAKRVVNEVHVNYDDIAPFVQDLSRAGLSFPNFNLANMVHWAGEAVNHPAEATALMRAYEVADKLSPDGKGGYNIPGTDMGVDLRSYASNTRLLKLASNPEYKLTYSERPAHKLYSAAELAMGGMTAPLDWVARKLDIQPKNPDPELSVWDDVVAAVSNSVKGERFRPTAELLRLTGMQDPGNPEGRREFEMKKLLRASELDGKPLSAEQANNLLKNMEAVNVLFGFTMGMYPKRMTPGSVQVEKGIQTYYRIYGAVEPHLGPKVKEYLDSQYPWMQGISPEPPIQKVIREQQKESEQEQNEDLELRRKQASASEGLGMAIAATPLGRIASAFSGTAQAAEGDDSAGKARKIQAAAEYDQVRGGWYPKGLPADISKVGTGQVKSGIENNVEREELVRRLERMPKVSDQVKLIDDTPNAMDLLIKTQDKRALPFIDSYNQVKAGQLVEQPSVSVYSKQQNYVKYWKKWVDDGLEISPAENARRLNAPMDVLTKELKLPPTHSVDRLDDEDLKVFRARYSADGKRVEMAKRLTSDPEAHHWANHLRTVLQRSPQETPFEVNRINSAIAALPDDSPRKKFWSNLKATDPALFEGIARGDAYDDMLAVSQAITLQTMEGRTFAVNTEAIKSLSQKGFGPLIAMAEDVGPKDVQILLRNLRDRNPEFARAYYSDDPDNLGSIKEHFEMRTEIRSVPSFYAGPQEQPQPQFMTPDRPPMSREEEPVQSLLRTGVLPQTSPAPATRFEAPPIPMRQMSSLPPQARPVFSEPARSGPGFIGDAIRVHAWQTKFNEAHGLPAPSWSSSFSAAAVTHSNRPIQQPDGSFRVQETVESRVSPGQVTSALGSLNQLAATGNALAGGNEDVANATNGMAAGLSTFAAIAMWAPAAGPAAPFVVAGAAVAGAAVGIMTGLGVGRKDGGRSAAASENARINQERLDLQRQQFAEQLRQQSIRDIRQREQDLTKAYASGFRPQSQDVQNRLQAFQRRGTFASKLGLIDAMERELSSALKPRW